MSDKIKVRITAFETVNLDKIIDIPKEEYQEYLDAVENDEDEDWFTSFADRYLDPVNDIVDSAGYEDVEVTPVKEK